jgi:hypothetical protein
MRSVLICGAALLALAGAARGDVFYHFTFTENNWILDA